MSRMSRAAGAAMQTSRYILLRNVPQTSTPNDIRRAVQRVGIQGVENIEHIYKNFRPTEKALLTMTTRNYVKAAISQISETGLSIGMVPVEAEAVYDKNSNNVAFVRRYGSGPTAGQKSGVTVTLRGLRGKARVSDIKRLLSDFEISITKVEQAELPPGKFSLFSTFIVTVKTESEAQRIVRKFHMTDEHSRDEAVQIRAEIIY